MLKMRNAGGKLRSLISIAIFLFSNGLSSNAEAQTFPTGFSQIQVATAILNPTAMAVAPDGRIFICQQAGAIRIVKNGALLATPFTTLTVQQNGERGLVGITLDPDFTNNGYVYVYYTVTGGTNNRLSRLTASGDLMLSNSEVVLLNFDALNSATNHNAGALHFGIDGKLYVGIGDNQDQTTPQNLNVYKGKILRINSDGTVPAGNPYLTGTAAKKRIWCYGVRNPFSMDIQPGTGRIFINDVGSNAWEEINDATTGDQNFGWPTGEGIQANGVYTDPVYTYHHGTSDSMGCAITGGVFFNPVTSNYPAVYTGKYFYIDYCSDWINTIDVNTGIRTNFAMNVADAPVSIVVGMDGNLYYISKTTRILYKIVYSLSSAPVITTQPLNVTTMLGQSASFSVAASGSQPFSYQWKKNNVNISGATSPVYTIASVVASDVSNYRCTVSNGSGSVTSNVVQLSVTSNNPPVATITSPINNSTFKAGDVISYSGTGTDIEDGTLPDGVFEWSLFFHHDSHEHDGPSLTQGTKNGSFSIPNNGETSDNVYYELRLVVTDALGNTDTTSVNILPRKSTITLNSVPTGMTLSIDGNAYTTPASVLSVEGMLRNILVTTPQNNGSFDYSFSNWQNGSTATYITVATPVNDTSITASFVVNYRIPENPTTVTTGLLYKCYTGVWTALPDFSPLTPVANGTVSTFTVNPKTQTDNFGLVFNGFVYVPTNGIYTFYTNSDDGSKLYIGDNLVVTNDGLHGAIEKSGQIGLNAGKHSIRVEYFEKTGGETLSVSYSGPGISKQQIPAGNLYRFTNTLSRQPVDDAFVKTGAFQYTAMGVASPTVLEIKKGDITLDSHREAYLLFDLDGITNDFTSVKLELYGKLKGTDLTYNDVEIVPISNTSWSENSITWSNRPTSTDPYLDSIRVTSFGAYKFYNFNLTNYIANEMQQGNTRVAFIVRCLNQKLNYIEFYSKEATTNRPRLAFSFPPPRLSTSETENQTEEILIYPNPVNNDFVTISVPSSCEQCTIELYSLDGKLLKSVNAETYSNAIDVSEFANGVYLVRVKSLQSVQSKMLQINR